jgi:hypothetical protein
MKDLNKYWLQIAKDQLLGRTITEVRYMSQEEMEGMGWSHRPVIMVLDDGNAIYPSADDEGNDGGSLFTNNEDNPVLPVLRNFN